MKWKLLIIAMLSIWVRFFALDTSTHFLSDESRDMVNIHQIFVERKFTLVGPISDDRSHVFSSLTYYMLLPFAVALNFDPLGTVTGAAVWGLLVWVMAVWLVKEQNPKQILLWAILAAVWYPLVQTSRWPWNPNLMPVWLFAGIFLSCRQNNWMRLLSGLCLGLSVHHHYLAIVPMALMLIWKRDWRMVLGAGLALAPFVIFDTMHPPGIFIGRMIEYNRTQMGTSLGDLVVKWPRVIKYFNSYVLQLPPLVFLGSALILGISGWDLWKKTPARPWLLIWLLTLIPLSMYSPQFHYLLPAVPFFAMWLLTARIGWGNKLASGLIIFLIFGSILSLTTFFNQPDWEGNLRILRGATNIMAEQIDRQKLVNPNLAVLASPDIYPGGKRYRDMLLVRNYRLKTYEEFERSDNLFVITKGSVEDLRRDPAGELLYFKNGPIAGNWEIPDSNWRVIQINRY